MPNKQHIFMITCPICKNTHDKNNLKTFESDCHFTPIEGIDQHLVRYQCSTCDVIFGPEDMLNLSEERVLKFYQDSYLSGYREKDVSNVEFALFKMLTPNRSGTYINWGGGTTSTTKRTKREGYTLLNYDPGIPETSEYITRAQLEKTAIDGIISHNVLDHLQDPIKDLLFMKSLLKPGACMIHASDGFHYELHFTKCHLFFFVGRSVEFISQAIGMSHINVPDKIKHAGNISIIRWSDLLG